MAGSRRLMGAGKLCAAAALRSGAGLVTWGFPRGEKSVAGSGPWEAMSLPLPETRDGALHVSGLGEIRRFIRERRVTAVALGPGLSTAPSTALLVRGLAGSLEIPVVADADALNILAAGWPPGAVSPLIATPHPGELARLLKISAGDVQRDRSDATRKFSLQRKLVCVLKGHQTVVTNGQTFYVNGTGNPGMATGGMGDVLAGMTAALVSQVAGQTLAERMLRAAAAAVFLHGLAGDLAVRRTTRVGLVAGDLPGFLPEAFRKTFGGSI